MSQSQIQIGGNPAVVAPIFPNAEGVQNLPFPNPVIGPSGLKPGMAVLIGNGTWAKADNTNGNTANPLGLYDGNGNVQSSGRLKLTTADWDTITGGSGGLTPGDLYYVDTAGGLTATKPSASGSYAAVVGKADSAEVIDVRLFAANGPHA